MSAPQPVRVRAQLVARIQARIGAAMAHDDGDERRTARVYQERHPSLTPEALAPIVVQNIEHLAAALIANVRVRTAVLDRATVADHWPLECGRWNVRRDDVLKFLSYMRWLASGQPPPFSLPYVDGTVVILALLSDIEHHRGVEWPNIAVDDVTNALLKLDDANARVVAEAARWLFRPAKPGALALADDDERSRQEALERQEAGVRFYREHTMVALEWMPEAVALLLATERDVRRGAESFRATPIPSSRTARAAMAAISRGAMGAWGALKQDLKGGGPVLTTELVWGGEREKVQLRLTFPSDFGETLLRGILQKLQEDGLRDYLVLHRMAAEQGRTGRFSWTWREHRERTAYDRRIRSDNLSDAEARKAVNDRLWRLHYAELRHVYQLPGGKTGEDRIGPHGLIDIPKHLRSKEGLELAVISLNPDLYSGAMAGGDGRHFTLLPDEAFALDGQRFRLAALLVLAMRDRRDEGGDVTLTARTLWDYLDTHGGTRARLDGRDLPERRRWPAADRTLQGSLDTLERHRVIGGWDRADGAADPRVLYLIRPRPEWTDQVVHGIPPMLSPSLADIPRRGSELRAWRDRYGLSQALAALALGVGIATVKRAELAGEAQLGGALAAALAACGGRPPLGQG